MAVRHANIAALKVPSIPNHPLTVHCRGRPVALAYPAEREAYPSQRAARGGQPILLGPVVEAATPAAPFKRDDDLTRVNAEGVDRTAGNAAGGQRLSRLC